MYMYLKTSGGAPPRPKVIATSGSMIMNTTIIKKLNNERERERDERRWRGRERISESGRHTCTLSLRPIISYVSNRIIMFEQHVMQYCTYYDILNITTGIKEKREEREEREGTEREKAGGVHHVDTKIS